MKSKYFVLLTLAFAGSAFADAGLYPQPIGEGTYPPPTIPTSVGAKSRAEVVAELREAQRLGLMTSGEGTYPQPTIPTSVAAKSRAEVVAELREAQRLGLLTVGEETGRMPSPSEARQIAEAGRRAAERERLTADRAHTE